MRRHFRFLALVFAGCLLFPCAYAFDISAPVLRVTQSGNDVTLSWTDVSGIVGYRLLYDAVPPETGFDGAFSGAVDLGYTKTITVTLPSDASYHVAIAAYNDTAVGPASNVEHVYTGDISQLTATALSPPTNVQATVSDKDLSLTWTASSSASGYRLYYGICSGDYTYEMPIDLGNVTSVSFNSLPVGVYYVALTAYTDLTESAFSDEVVVTIGKTDAYETVSQSDGITYQFDASASTLENQSDGTGVFTVSGTLPDMFPDGTMLNVYLIAKGADHPTVRTRPYQAETFLVRVEGGKYAATVTHAGQPYAPMTYEMQIAFYPTSNHSTIATYVAELMAEHFSGDTADTASQGVFMVAQKDLVVGTRREHMAYRLKTLQDLKQHFDAFVPIYQELSEVVSGAPESNTTWSATKESLTEQLSAYNDEMRAWKKSYVASQEIDLSGSLSAATLYPFQVMDWYDEGNHTATLNYMERLTASLSAFQGEMERKLAVITRVVNVRAP